MATTITGKDAIAKYLQAAGPNADFQVLSGGNAFLQDPFLMQSLANQQSNYLTQMQDEQAKQLAAQGPGGLAGFLGNIGKGIVDPFARLGTSALIGGLNMAGQGNEARMVQDQAFGKDSNVWEQALKGGIGVGSWLVPGLGPTGSLLNMASRGALAGGLGALSTQDFLTKGVDVGKVGQGALMGGGIAGGLGLLGKGFGALQKASQPQASTSILGKFDKAIQDQTDDLLRSGIDPKQIAKELGSTGELGKINPGLNYLSGSKEIVNRLSQKGFNPSSVEKAVMAQELLARGGDKVPEFMRTQLQQVAAAAPTQTTTQASKGLLQGLGEKIKSNADATELGQFTRELGRPAKQLGSVDLFKQAQNIKIGDQPLLRMGDSADDVLAKTQSILDDQGSLVKNATNELSAKGVTVDVTKMRDFLRAKADGAMVPQLKEPYLKALNVLDDSTGVTEQVRNGFLGKPLPATVGSQMPVDKFYQLKQQIGSLGKWNQFTPPADTQAAKAYNGLYMKMNDALDDTLKANGFDAFRGINKNLSIAQKLQNHIEGRIASAAGTKPVGMGELIGGLGGVVISGGNPLGAIPGVALSQLQRSNGVQRAFIDAQRGLGNALAGAPNVQVPFVDKIGGALNSPAMNAIVSNPMTARIPQMAAATSGMLTGDLTLNGPPQAQPDVLGASTMAGGDMGGGASPEQMMSDASGMPPAQQNNYTLDPATGQFVPSQMPAMMGMDQGQGLPGQGMGGGPTMMELFQAALADTGDVRQAMAVAEFLAPYVGVQTPGGMGMGKGGKVDKDVASLQLAEGLVDEAAQMSQGLGLGDNTILQKIGAPIRGMAASAGLDPTYDQYRAQKQALVARIARAMGETGPMTDVDIARYSQMLPDAGDTQEQAAQKVTILRNRLQRAQQVFGGSLEEQDPYAEQAYSQGYY